ncbi:class D beta-lactamase [Massilia pseudoviolaceinigra]|uniref:class D beta-lactamase n=1 Tax=Massilia pseudoviolaceinigra TaxID=3057165 RepID=UPI0027965AE2|nr:class D beta-lactamase [Massilia sp. CCM 9206]MDQ1924447.1 class D beta-lactamase [Massilia sp. CCM 9206]
MNPTELLMFRFLLASGGCIGAGLAVWAAMALCRRALPAVASQRSVWLLGQITIVAAFLVILLPHSERLRLVPPIEIESVAQAHVATPDNSLAASSAASAPSPQSAETAGPSWLALGAQAWLLCYLLGLGYAIVRLLQARRILNSLVASGGHLRAPQQHDGFIDKLPLAPRVIEVDAPISPMLFGLFKPRLLLPVHLRRFETAQQQMMVEHELTHLRRHDLHWISASVLLQTLLWFNPFMRLLRANLSWALELGCDRDVLSGRPATQRKAYAAALVAQLKMQRSPATNALAFGAVSARTLAGRIALIREPGAMSHGRWTRLAAFAALASVLIGSLALQPTLAWRGDSASPSPEPAAQTPSPASPTASTNAVSCTELADAASGKRLVREGQCDERITPASTFNIAVSLMGYDSGILEDEHAPRMPFRKEYVHWNPAWRTATDPTSWFTHSVLWFAQQVTSQLGAARFQGYVNSFNYGNQDVSGDPDKGNGLALSWVSSSLKISPAEQVTFLRKVVNRQLPLAPKAYDMTLRIMQPETLDNGWKIHGKTGTASPVLPDGRDDPAHQYGWYVGWASKGERTIVFARMALERRQEGFAGGRVKEAFLRDLRTRLDTL